MKKLLRRLLRNTIAYLHNILIALDQLLNAVLFGDPDETLSSRLGKCDRLVCKILCLLVGLFFFNIKHCKQSIEYDEGKADLLKKWLG